jgi:hypothetical protein
MGGHLNRSGGAALSGRLGLHLDPSLLVLEDCPLVPLPAFPLPPLLQVDTVRAQIGMTVLPEAKLTWSVRGPVLHQWSPY